MELEVDPPVAEGRLLAIRRALGIDGVRASVEPAGARSEWRRAAAREAVDTEPAGPRYALSPRSTRGATRA